MTRRPAPLLSRGMRSLLGTPLLASALLASPALAQPAEPAEPTPEPARLRLDPPGALGAAPADPSSYRLPPPTELPDPSVQLQAPTLDDPTADQALDEAINEPWIEDDEEFEDEALDAEGWGEPEPLEDETAAALDDIGVTGEAEAEVLDGEAHGEGEHDGAHGPGAEHEGEEGHHEAHFDGLKFTMTVLNFLIWLGFVVWLARKPVSEYLKNRRMAVEEGIEEAKRLSAEAEEKHAEYSARLERLDEALEMLRKEVIQAGEAESDRIIQDAEARAARMRKDARFLVDQQMKQLRVDLTREAIEAAVSAAAEVLAEQVQPGDQQRLADEYLQQIAESMKDEEARA